MRLALTMTVLQSLSYQQELWMTTKMKRRRIVLKGPSWTNEHRVGSGFCLPGPPR